MNVFVSWSGNVAKQVAEALRDWLPLVVPSLSPWVSSQDIASGTSWNAAINAELGASGAGIICVTRSNVEKPWVQFEAGALAGQGKPATPYLIGMKPAEIGGNPLRQLQARGADEGGTRQLVSDLARMSIPTELGRRTVATAFEREWPTLESFLDSLDLSAEGKPLVPPPGDLVRQLEGLLERQQGRAARRTLDSLYPTVRPALRFDPPPGHTVSEIGNPFHFVDTEAERAGVAANLTEEERARLREIARTHTSSSLDGLASILRATAERIRSERKPRDGGAEPPPGR